MTELIAFLYAIGGMFTLGFTVDDNNERQRLILFIAIFWPVALGAAIRGIIDRREAVEAKSPPT